MDYKEFKVLVENRRKIVITKPNKITEPGDVRYDARTTERLIKIFSRWLADDKIRTREELVVLGTYLFNILFDDETKKIFKTEYDKISDKESTGLRVVLEFTPEARDLAVLPWEYIYYPDGEEGTGFFIATDNQLILARHVPLKMKVLDPAPKPLRILIIVSTPQRDDDGEKELFTIVEGEVIKTIEGLSRNSKGAIEIDRLEQPNKNVLTRWIQDHGRYHVVHFVGHGKYKKEEGGSLALTNSKDPKIAAWIKDVDFADCFRKREPRLVFLNACEGASSEYYAAFQGIALQLVYSNIPAVVAMQYEIENRFAKCFAVKFYQSLGEGKPIDVAVQEGRLELGMFSDDAQNYSNRAFGSPVVFLQSAAGIVIAEKQAEKSESFEELPAPGRASEEVPCPYLYSASRCKGFVPAVLPPYFTTCPTCRQELMQCPNNHVMMKRTGTCACGYIVQSKPVSTAVETVDRVPQPTLQPAGQTRTGYGSTSVPATVPQSPDTADPRLSSNGPANGIKSS